MNVLRCALVENRLPRATVRVLGPEQLDLSNAVRRVADTIGRKPLFFPAPLAFRYGLAAICETMMKIPLVSFAQVRILSEGIVDPAGPCEDLPQDLAPHTPFSAEEIRRRLPEAGPFGLSDLRCCRDASA